jgi:hypothetical protein
LASGIRSVVVVIVDAENRTFLRPTQRKSKNYRHPSDSKSCDLDESRLISIGHSTLVSRRASPRAYVTWANVEGTGDNGHLVDESVGAP